MGNFLPKYPKNYFKNQKGLRSFWKMISIGISIIFGILACIDKFEKQWELNVFYFGIALLLFYIFIHPVWMDAKKKKGYKFEEDRIYVFNILGKQTRMIAYQTMEKAVQKRQGRCKNNGLVIGKGRNKICFLYEPGSLEAAKRVRQCYDMLQKHIEPALPCFRQTGQDLLDRRAFYRRCRKRQTILLLIGSFFAGVFCARKIMKLRPAAKGIWDGILTMPLVLPPTVAGFFLLMLFSLRRPFGKFLMDSFDIRIVQSWAGCVIAASVIAFPLMYRNARAAFEQVDVNLIYAGRTLGMSESRIFWKVIMPAARPGIASGTVLAFARAIGEYGATSMLAGNILGKTRTVSVAIAAETAAGNYDKAGFWVAIILVLSFVIVAVINIISGKGMQTRRWI